MLINDVNKSESQSNPVQFLDKFFDENNQQKHKLSASVSFDEGANSSQSSARISSNRKLEEFKRVVESSYNQHVVKKKIETLVNIKNKQIQLTKKHLYETLKSSDTAVDLEQDQCNVSSSNIFLSAKNDANSSLNSSLAESQPADLVNKNSKKTAYEIPYMSAYNVYKKTTNRFKDELDTSSLVHSSNTKLNEPDTDVKASFKFWFEIWIIK